MYLNFEETKQAFLSLLERGKCYRPMELRTRLHIEKGLRESQTVSELTSCVANAMRVLYAAYRNFFLELVRESLTHEDWAAQHIFFNTANIRCNYGQERIEVMDGSVAAIQETYGHVTYYGNVDLTINSGNATVVDSALPIRVHGMVDVEAYGSTSVIADGQASIHLHEYARAEVSGMCQVIADDYAFVESKSTDVQISAYNDSQVLIQEGVEHLSLCGNVRCVILSQGLLTKRTKVELFDCDALIVTQGMHPDQIECCMNCTGHLMVAEDFRLRPSQVCDLIVPRHDKDYKLSVDCIEEPMDLARLKNDLIPYLSGVADDMDMRALELAKNEQEVCAIVAEYLLPLIDKGLTGAFLRSHFTNLTLTSFDIYNNNSQTKCLHGDVRNRARYFFGNQIVEDSVLNDVYGFEHTLFLYHANKVAVQIGCRDTLLATDTGLVTLSEDGIIKADGGCKVIVRGEHAAVLSDRSVGIVYGLSSTTDFEQDLTSCLEVCDDSFLASDTETPVSTTEEMLGAYHPKRRHAVVEESVEESVDEMEPESDEDVWNPSCTEDIETKTELNDLEREEQ